jgi:hypothetical protein
MKDDGDKNRLPWFECHPEKLLNALAGLASDEGYLYVIVLLRIYEIGGPCPDTVQALANRTHMTARRVERALASLVDIEKLTRTEAGLVNGFAARVLSKQQVVRKRRSQGAKTAAEKRWGKDKEKQQTENADGTGEHAHLHLHLQEPKNKKEDSGGVAPPPKIKTDKGTRIPNDWTLTPERLAYGLGRGLTEREVRRDAEKFVNYWRAQTGQKGVKAGDAGWEATWRNWCISSAERLGREPRAAVNGHDGTLDPRKFTHDAWRDALKVYRLTNNWNPRFGPEPGKAGCLVPSELLQPRLV